MPPSPKHALESAYRLRSVASVAYPKIEDQSHRRQQWNGNVQGATNDSGEYHAAVRIVDGFPVEYSCLDDPRGNDLDEVDVGKILVAFDYEMISRKNTDVEKSMRSLEWSLLWNVARNLGLHNCNYRKQDPEFDTRRKLARSENYVVGLSSLEFDRVDHQTKRCTILVNKAEEGTICTPMLGTMTAHFTGDRDTVKKYLELNIEQEMNSRRVRIEEVKECRYIGDRSGLRANASTRMTLDSKNNSTNLALVFGVLVGVVMLFFAILLARGRRSSEEAVVLDDGEIDDNEQMPSPLPPIIPLQQREETKAAQRPSNSGDSNDSMIHPIDFVLGNDEDKGLQPVSIATIASGNMDGPVPINHYPIFRGLDERSSNSNPEGSGGNENIDPPHLPTLCVVPLDTILTKEPIESKTLKRRRKRKKRKKKQRVLKRVSSKQNINEMETISELDEGGANIDHEGSGCDGSEYSASEYSTDDEDDSIFVMNTPTSASDDGTSPKVSLGPVIPPSPIREEPKIRKLPPPWI